MFSKYSICTIIKKLKRILFTNRISCNRLSHHGSINVIKICLEKWDYVGIVSIVWFMVEASKKRAVDENNADQTKFILTCWNSSENPIFQLQCRKNMNWDNSGDSRPGIASWSAKNIYPHIFTFMSTFAKIANTNLQTTHPLSLPVYFDFFFFFE